MHSGNVNASDSTASSLPIPHFRELREKLSKMPPPTSEELATQAARLRQMRGETGPIENPFSDQRPEEER